MPRVSMPSSAHFSVPPLACDCHMHVFGDPAAYPVADIRSYTPQEASIEAWRNIAGPLGLRRVVVVQPSAYGADNRCIVDALGAVGSSGRGVAQINRATDLAALHTAGVRGVRLNPKSIGMKDVAGLRALINETAERVGPLGWHLQLYMDLAALPDIADVLGDSVVPVVLDHMAGARAGDTQAALLPLLRLLGRGRCWVKLSGAYRVSQFEDGFEDSIGIARALVDSNAEQLVWGTDWPHTASHGGIPRPDAPVIRFRSIDSSLLLDLLAAATGDQATFSRILQDNPARLYDF